MEEREFRSRALGFGGRRESGGGGGGGGGGAGGGMTSKLAKFLKPYVLKVQVSSRQMTAHVIHRITTRTIAMCDSREAQLRDEMAALESVGRAARVGELLASRLREKDVNQVVFQVEEEVTKVEEANKQRMLRAFTDKLVEGGVDFV